jgi:hypothetical protein
MFDFPFERPANLDFAWLDGVLRGVLDARFTGITLTEQRVIVHMIERPSAADWSMIDQIIRTGSFGLTVVANKSVIQANNSDSATIVCNSPILAADASVSYVVHFTGTIDGTPYEAGEYATGTASVESGVVTLTLAVDFAGSYRVTLRRAAPAREFGTVVVNAVEG